MKDTDMDKHLRRHLSGDPPREAFKQQALRDSTAALVRIHKRRSAWRRAELAAAAVLIASVGFLGGRLSMPHTLPSSVDVVPHATAEPDGVTVPSDLVAWLDAARLFKRLGMEERMARAVERAGRLLPVETVIADNQAGQVFAARSIENQNKHMDLTDMPGPHPSAESVNQILAQSFGD
jgi:hypothetical protein